MAVGSWTEVLLDSPPGGFVATDAVNVYFDVGKGGSAVSVRDLTMKTCVRVGSLFAVRSRRRVIISAAVRRAVMF